MRNLRLKYLYPAIILILAIPKVFVGQVPDFSKVPNVHEGDSLGIIYLINNGIKITDGKVVAWFPRDSLTEKRMTEITRMLNAGITGAEKFIKAPLSWQVQPSEAPYTFYFRFDRFVSHASLAGFMSIPFWRIKEGKAPWLHEVIHEMLYSKSERDFGKALTEKDLDEMLPLWLYEGLADYISLQVSILEKLPRFDVFSNSEQTDFDSLFVRDMDAERSAYILSFIGAKGVMQELSSKDRSLYAPAFYHGSYSFVKYIAGHYGINTLLSGIAAFGQEHQTIESMTGKSLEMLKKEWLDELKIIK